ncbi:hypothetical protein BDZ94DRAFT_445104 [Collybia nuda]|uniref:Uncharacterized protein n=1 Tax=Collybia nuda TaxID=64659 RepID=A0A9P5Y9W3_9AGAR|nr:hypothetical protein BDZ94DRAFT_445104 [Collybia nuda]
MTSATPPASSLVVPMNPQVPPQTGPRNTSSMTRLKTLIANWEHDGPPQSYFELPGTKVKIYKDNASKVYLVTPNKKGGYAYIGASSLDDIISKISQSTSKPDASVYSNAAGHTHVVNNPRTAEQATVYRPHGETLQQPPAPVVISLGEHQPVVSANGKPALPVLRTPKDADKAHLARDILRALTKKRPRPEGMLIPSQEPTAKRHALDIKAGRTLDGVIPNTITNPPMLSVPLPVISQPPSQPPTSGPTQPISHSQSVFRIEKQAPVLAPPSMTAPKPTAPTSVVSLLQSTANINNSVSSVPYPVIAPSILPATQPSSAQHVLPSNLGSAPSSSNLAAPRVEPTLRQSSPSVFASELDNGKEKTPLFLPSPSSSPPLEAPRSASLGSGVSLPTNTEVGSSKSGSGRGRKRQLCYVLVPPLPNYIKRSKAKERASIKEDTGMIM